MARKPKAPTEITSTRHKNETRVNIPTEELRDFVAEDEKAPKAILYPRDPSLDPQLVWKGKDEQDQAALEVPVVPVRSPWRACLLTASWRRMTSAPRRKRKASATRRSSSSR
jgi:hypothetical protein